MIKIYEGFGSLNAALFTVLLLDVGEPMKAVRAVK